jgi:hypothetical protein
MKKTSRHTGTKSEYREAGPAEEARVDTWELFINDFYEFLVARLLGAVRNRGNDASADVFCVAWVLAIGDRCGDERVLLRDTERLCKVDYFVSVVLLVADAAYRKKCVDAGGTRPAKLTHGSPVKMSPPLAGCA